MLKLLHYIFIKRKRPYLFIIYLSGALTRLLRIKCYCTLCGRWFDPIESDFIEAEKACSVCWAVAEAETADKRKRGELWSNA